MLLGQFMSRNPMHGCRGVRRNAARSLYREANNTARHVNSTAETVAASEPAKPFNLFRSVFGDVILTATPNRPAPAVEPVKTAEPEESNVIELDDAAAKVRAAKDKKNKAARDRRAAAKLASDSADSIAA